jgi:hypothetical protein
VSEEETPEKKPKSDGLMKSWQAGAIIVLLNLVLVMLAWQVLIGPPQRAAQWTYRVDQIREDALNRHLDRYGVDGWEVVVASRIRGAHTFDVILKKER